MRTLWGSLKAGRQGASCPFDLEISADTPQRILEMGCKQLSESATKSYSASVWALTGGSHICLKQVRGHQAESKAGKGTSPMWEEPSSLALQRRHGWGGPSCSFRHPSFSYLQHALSGQIWCLGLLCEQQQGTQITAVSFPLEPPIKQDYDSSADEIYALSLNFVFMCLYIFANF